MKTCGNCGLGTKDENGLISCFKYKTLHNTQDDKASCIYYIETVIEDGEPLPPLQHLLLKEQELKQHKIKGVI